MQTNYHISNNDTSKYAADSTSIREFFGNPNTNTAETYSESSQISELASCAKIVKVDHDSHKAPSHLFDWVLNTPLIQCLKKG